MSGCYDGAVALWSQLKKKPVCIHRGAHCAAGATAAAAGASGGGSTEARGAGSVDEASAGWVQSVAVCPGGDLVVRSLAVSECVL